jgi:fermentation-respiration switch protein FrsA (DUF1100 family)
MTILLVAIVWMIVAIVFVSAVLFVIGPGMLLQPYRRTIEYYRKYTTVLHPSDIGLPYEDVALKTPEGIGLSCWLIPAEGMPKGTVIYLHGVSECKIVGIPMARELHNLGYNVFLYDSRRHGDSGGTYCTYGFYEKHDARAVITYVTGRADINPGRIGLFGTSMGAAVAIQVASIDPRVVALIAESGFATLRTIFDDYQKRMIKLPWHYLRNIVIKRSEHLAHFKANAVSPLEAVRSVHVPVFIMHGTADTLIDSRYSETVFAAANEPKGLWLIAGARHNDMDRVGGEEYWRRVLEFFVRNLSGQSGNQ